MNIKPTHVEVWPCAVPEGRQDRVAGYGVDRLPRPLYGTVSVINESATGGSNGHDGRNRLVERYLPLASWLDDVLEPTCVI